MTHRNPYLKDITTLSIDIETVPADGEEVRERIAASVQPPGNISKPETIAAWEATRKPDLVEAAFRAGALSAVTGKIICIGMVSQHGELSFCGDDEPEITRAAYGYLQSLDEPITYVGHNIAGFDLPFLRQRSIVHRIRPPLSLAKAWRAKPWDGSVGDSMVMWDSDKQKRISLDKLCRLLGIASPKDTGVDGSQVYDLYVAGEMQRIADYCLADCRAALECYRRIQEVA